MEEPRTLKFLAMRGRAAEFLRELEICEKRERESIIDRVWERILGFSDRKGGDFGLFSDRRAFSFPFHWIGRKLCGEVNGRR